MTTPIRRFPTEGWHFIECIDLQSTDPSGLVRTDCERCNRQLRLVHKLVHDDWPRPIFVGQCCAIRLAGFYVKDWEREARNRANRRRSFLNTARWKHNVAKNTLTRKARGVRVTVFPASWGFGLFVGDERGSISATQAEALNAAFTILDKVGRP